MKNGDVVLEVNSTPVADNDAETVMVRCFSVVMHCISCVMQAIIHEIPAQDNVALCVLTLRTQSL